MHWRPGAGCAQRGAARAPPWTSAGRRAVSARPQPGRSLSTRRDRNDARGRGRGRRNGGQPPGSLLLNHGSPSLRSFQQPRYPQPDARDPHPASATTAWKLFHIRQKQAPHGIQQGLGHGTARVGGFVGVQNQPLGLDPLPRQIAVIFAQAPFLFTEPFIEEPDPCIGACNATRPFPGTCPSRELIGVPRAVGGVVLTVLLQWMSGTPAQEAGAGGGGDELRLRAGRRGARTPRADLLRHRLSLPVCTPSGASFARMCIPE